MQEDVKKEETKKKRRKKEISKKRKIITYILFVIIVVPVAIEFILYKVEDYKIKNKKIPKSVVVDGHKISINNTYKDIENSDFYIFNMGAEKVEPGKRSYMELRTKDNNVYIELSFYNFGTKEKKIEECPIYAIEVTKSRAQIDSPEHSIVVSDGVRLGDNYNNVHFYSKYYTGYSGHRKDSDGLEYWYYKDKSDNELYYYIDDSKIYCAEMRLKIGN